MNTEEMASYHIIEDPYFPAFLYMNEDGDDENVENLGTICVEEVSSITDQGLEETQHIVAQLQETEPTVNNGIQFDMNELFQDICDIRFSRITGNEEEANMNYTINEWTSDSADFDNAETDFTNESPDDYKKNEKKYFFSSQFPASMNNLYTPLDFAMIPEEQSLMAQAPISPILIEELTPTNTTPSTLTPIASSTSSTTLTSRNSIEANQILSECGSESHSDVYHIKYSTDESNLLSSPVMSFNIVEPNEDLSDNINNSSLTKSIEAYGASNLKSTSVELLCSSNVIELVDHKPTFIVRPHPGQSPKSTVADIVNKIPSDEIVQSPLKSTKAVKKFEQKISEERFDDISSKDIVIPVIKHKPLKNENRRKQKIVTKPDIDSFSFGEINVENANEIFTADKKQRQKIRKNPKAIEIYKIKMPSLESKIDSNEFLSNNLDDGGDSTESKNEEKLIEINKVGTEFEKSQDIVSGNFSDTDTESETSELQTFTKQSQCYYCQKYFKSVRSLLKHIKQCYFVNSTKNSNNYLNSEEEKNVTNNNCLPSDRSQTSLLITINKSALSNKDVTNTKSTEDMQRNILNASLKKQPNDNNQMKPNDFCSQNEREQALENFGLKKIIAGQYYKLFSEEVDRDKNVQNRPNTRSQTKDTKRPKAVDQNFVLRKKRKM